MESNKNIHYNDAQLQRENFDKTIFWLNTTIIIITFLQLLHINDYHNLITFSIYWLLIPNISSIISFIFNLFSDFIGSKRSEYLSHNNSIEYSMKSYLYSIIILICNYIYIIFSIISIISILILLYIQIYNL